MPNPVNETGKEAYSRAETVPLKWKAEGFIYAMLPKRWTPPVEIAAFKKWFAENAGVLFDGSAPEARRALMSISIMNQENYKYSRSIHAATQKCLREFQDFLSAANHSAQVKGC